MPKIMLTETGELVTMVNYDKYKSDAVRDFSYLWFASEDRGSTWQGRYNISCLFPPTEYETVPPIKLSDGTVLGIGSYGWENYSDTPENRRELTGNGYYLFGPEDGNASGIISICHRVWKRWSIDGGLTWRKSEILLPFMPHFAMYGNPIVTRRGTILQPMWGRYDLEQEPRHVSSLVLRSEDNGQTWEVKTIAKASQGPEGIHFNETEITEAANGDIIALIRTSDQKELWTAISCDDGKTWDTPRDSGLRGSTPTIVTTKDDLVVAVYVRRSPKDWAKTGVFACVSRNHGKTWNTNHQIAIHDTGKDKNGGYPATIALPDGTVYTVYSFKGSKALGGTRFDPRHAIFEPN